MAHTNTYATYISKESLFIRCVNSCQATASISLLSKFCNNPEVKAIRESFCLHHVAKAFIHDSFIIAILGIGNHLDMHRFSTILYISGFSFLVMALAQDKLNIISFCKANEIIHRSHNTINMIGNIHSVMFSQSSRDPVSVKKKVNITQNITNKSAGKRTNNKAVFLWFSALKLCIH